jgi:hypothetical protein
MRYSCRRLAKGFNGVGLALVVPGGRQERYDVTRGCTLLWVVATVNALLLQTTIANGFNGLALVVHGGRQERYDVTRGCTLLWSVATVNALLLDDDREGLQRRQPQARGPWWQATAI